VVNTPSTSPVVPGCSAAEISSSLPIAAAAGEKSRRLGYERPRRYHPAHHEERAPAVFEDEPAGACGAKQTAQRHSD
jgi:hypothetical protein